MAPGRVFAEIPTEGQRSLCLALGCMCLAVSNQDTAGLRHPVAPGTTGWYIWCGEESSDAPDFFQALCVDHLIDSIPAVTEFLALPPGYRFLLHGTYRDVWFDEQLLKV